ncbi:MAG TPA: hypothetical protein VIH31_00710 [Candidatus Paceibacterota bacterium]|uniref:Uncharacterized protein n=1 Tax=uncultured Parcubacteria bacterium Rifle_16ft_4_minimus_2958 TaxID=1665137 RepID=A0A0H4T2J3_9BACT|nr:hypothetical protein [uncultured Parcubacteria bacterium Rifle_16ft_4_minimus_2958]
MKTISQLGAFFGMLFSIMTSKKFSSLVEEKIDFGKLQDVMNSEDKADLVNEFIKFINNGCKLASEAVNKMAGCLKKVTEAIILEATADFKIADFFKTKDQGGIFAYVDSDIFSWLSKTVKNSPALELASYEFTKDITEQGIIDDAKGGDIYVECDMAHVKQICERHIVKGEKLLKDNGQANLFWVRDKDGDLCEVFVNRNAGGWYVRMLRFRSGDEWAAGYSSFFRNKDLAPVAV